VAVATLFSITTVVRTYSDEPPARPAGGPPHLLALGNKTTVGTPAGLEADWDHYSPIMSTIGVMFSRIVGWCSLGVGCAGGGRVDVTGLVPTCCGEESSFRS